MGRIPRAAAGRGLDLILPLRLLLIVDREAAEQAVGVRRDHGRLTGDAALGGDGLAGLGLHKGSLGEISVGSRDALRIHPAGEAGALPRLLDQHASLAAQQVHPVPLGELAADSMRS